MFKKTFVSKFKRKTTLTIGTQYKVDENSHGRQFERTTRWATIKT